MLLCALHLCIRCVMHETGDGLLRLNLQVQFPSGVHVLNHHAGFCSSCNATTTFQDHFDAKHMVSAGEHFGLNDLACLHAYIFMCS